MASLTTNLASLVSKRNVDMHSHTLSRSIEKISSGRRTVRPGDDPTSLAISNKMKANISALRQAGRNVSQGASMLQIAAGSLSQTAELLTRLKTLAVRVANDSFSSTERSLADTDFQGVIEQINSVAENTRMGSISLLTSPPGRVVFENRSSSSRGLNAVANAFTGNLVESLSSGHIQHTWKDRPGDVKVDIDTDTQTVSLVIGDEVYEASSVVESSNPMIFTSRTHEDNRFAIEVDANATAVVTSNDLAVSLTSLFQGSTLLIGHQETVTNAAAHAAFEAPEELIDLARTSGNVFGAVANVAVNGTNGDYTVSMDIGGETFQGSGIVVTNHGRLELVSTQNSGNRLSLNFSNDTQTITDAASFEGALNVVLQNADFSIGDEAVGNGLGTTTAFANSVNARLSKGFIDGASRDMDIKRVGNDLYDITLKVGDREFVHESFSSSQAMLRLVDTKNSDNIIAIDVIDQTAVTTQQALTNELNTLFGFDLDPSYGTVNFISASGANGKHNGIHAGKTPSFRADAMSKPGKYAFSYDADDKVFRLTDGHQVWERALKENSANRRNGTYDVHFANGINVYLGEEENKFSENIGISQTTFTVGLGDRRTFEFQISDRPGDDLKINIASTTVSALGLENLTITNFDKAGEAFPRIEHAINVVNTSLAMIGAAQGQFDHTQSALGIQIENTQNALSTFEDVDLSQEIIKMTAAESQVQAAVSMLTQANQLSQNLLRLLP